MQSTSVLKQRIIVSHVCDVLSDIGISDSVVFCSSVLDVGVAVL